MRKFHAENPQTVIPVRIGRGNDRGRFESIFSIFHGEIRK
ncbi:hypothetical protein B4135_0624 [Caldibacillus debilis]|uniref:Uncharacterized protein n=1 Tax=Caldibacillus debilis TaxID=301148 RepID=A0A150MFK0_9BACI|nr:hypothetical protein B4135_0624 [Caldibacillus debilis]